jgi:endoglucanase
MPHLPANPLPRWRGFNLLHWFTTRSDGVAQADDFRFAAEWGFDFVRIPMCYLLWTDAQDLTKVDQAAVERIDETVELGRGHGLHVSLNLHRAPGYSVNRERDERLDLWKDAEALDAFCFQWELLARRYAGIPSSQLSFDLVNEPPAPRQDGMRRADYERVARAAVAAIRRVDPERLVIADGVSWGNDPVPELADLGIGQSCRGYLPMPVSHYQAAWVCGERFPLPQWPSGSGAERWDRQRLEQHYDGWADLVRQGVGVHCGECGCYNRTPHAVFLAWFEDVLTVLTERGIGYALWNLRGSFGVLDSDRSDVAYQDWHGHQLDRKLLELMQRY